MSCADYWRTCYELTLCGKTPSLYTHLISMLLVCLFYGCIVHCVVVILDIAVEGRVTSLQDIQTSHTEDPRIPYIMEGLMYMVL
eukprot:m.209051 g.209051  ORF g.209051 m.209051 type:complete len:84 (+) comp15811_c0_seq5:962-1213(+)